MQKKAREKNRLQRRRICPGCPVTVERVVLISADGRDILRIEMRNDSGSVLTGVTFLVSIRCADAAEDSDPVAVRVRYRNTRVMPGAAAACRSALTVPAENIRSYEVIIETVEREGEPPLTYSADDWYENEKQTPSLMQRIAELPRAVKITAASAAVVIIAAITLTIVFTSIFSAHTAASVYDKLIAAADFEGALELAQKNGDADAIIRVRSAAADYYFAAGDVSTALGWVASAVEYDYTPHIDAIWKSFKSAGNLDGGLEWLSKNIDLTADDAMNAFSSCVLDAIVAALGDGDYDRAVGYAEYSGGGDIYTLLADAVETKYLAGEYDIAYKCAAAILEIDPTADVRAPGGIAADAAKAAADAHDYDKAERYAALAVDTDPDIFSYVWSSAVNYYMNELNDAETALKYAQKAGDSGSQNSVYEAAARRLLDAPEDEITPETIEAALEYARKTTGAVHDALVSEALCRRALIYYKNYELSPNNDAFEKITDALAEIDELNDGNTDLFFKNVSKSFMRRNLRALWRYASPASRREYNARKIAVYKLAVRIDDDGNAVCDAPLGWTKLASVSAREHIIAGLLDNGSVVTYGDTNFAGQLDTGSWFGIIDAEAGETHTVGLYTSGSVRAVGSNAYGQCDVGDWTGVVSVAAGAYHTVALKIDGTVLATGKNDSGQCDVAGWSNIVAVECGPYHTVGLRADGTVVAAGDNTLGKCDVSGWTNIVAIAAGDCMTVGLRADGTVVVAGSPVYGSLGDYSSWKNVSEIFAGAVCVGARMTDGYITITGDGAPNLK